ncbi:MAG: hypothetical protein JNN08_21740 [Bryobacterales bacterium]|nr:hypothetical protein [Bryobacterales bacterium]
MALVILAVVLYYSNRQAEARAVELGALKVVRDTLSQDLDKRKQAETSLVSQIASWNANQGSTKEESDRVAREKADLEARLAESRKESGDLAVWVKESADLVASVKSLQSRLEQIQKERDDAVRAQAAAETKAGQLEGRVNTLTKELEAARGGTVRRTESTKEGPVAGSKDTKTPNKVEQAKWRGYTARESEISQGNISGREDISYRR